MRLEAALSNAATALSTEFGSRHRSPAVISASSPERIPPEEPPPLLGLEQQLRIPSCSITIRITSCSDPVPPSGSASASRALAVPRPSLVPSSTAEPLGVLRGGWNPLLPHSWTCGHFDLFPGIANVLRGTRSGEPFLEGLLSTLRTSICGSCNLTKRIS